ncbi:hypothetical protein KL86DES1_21022 [uncultured Desulfovibrio sp.]|uniref:Uncharacterized protein n=1 Tax=uncultured Desulfovibrio sp. TaxID=167968 RepID=A0A212L6C6_9BACT|nr:hypothetical protein KL86DES1_21022 [uncultured Desulfovibrio sp.]VZH33922.1 conserved protein of unknown function [Desulfovibrio sp. 86]
MLAYGRQKPAYSHFVARIFRKILAEHLLISFVNCSRQRRHERLFWYFCVELRRDMTENSSRGDTVQILPLKKSPKAQTKNERPPFAGLSPMGQTCKGRFCIFGAFSGRRGWLARRCLP